MTKTVSFEQNLFLYFPDFSKYNQIFINKAKKLKSKTLMWKDGISAKYKMSTNKQTISRTQVLCKSLRYYVIFSSKFTNIKETQLVFKNS